MKRARAKRGHPLGIHLKTPMNGIKPKIRLGAPITPIPPTGGFNAHSGEVMGAPRVRAVYWGNAYGNQTGLTQTTKNLENFFASIFPTPYFGLLAEYSVNMPIYFGSVWLPHDPTLSISVTPDFIINTVTAWLDGGLLPEVPGRTEKNLLYIVFLSPEMTIATTPPGCAFHYWGHYQKGSGKHNLFVAAIGSGGLAALTGSASHELAEAFTDRSGNGWYSDVSPKPEIGDVCSCCVCPTLTLNGFTLSSYWRNSVSNCLQQTDLTPPPPPPPQPLVSVTPFPVPLNRPTTFSLNATDPATGADVPGAADILQPTAAGTVRVANFRVPGTSPKLTLHSVTRGVKGEREVINPTGMFRPDDQTNFQNAEFDLELF
jgi:hypothetical protein